MAIIAIASALLTYVGGQSIPMEVKAPVCGFLFAVAFGLGSFWGKSVNIGSVLKTTTQLNTMLTPQQAKILASIGQVLQTTATSTTAILEDAESNNVKS